MALPMGRPSLNETLLEVARVVARRSTCSRLNVGAVLARDTRVISTGYNGAMAGAVHCRHDCTCPPTVTRDKRVVHSHWCDSLPPCALAVHAEANALAFAAKHGVSTDGSHLYVTHAPCAPCARLLVNAGVTSVTYADDYRSNDGLDVLHAAGVHVSKGD